MIRIKARVFYKKRHSFKKKKKIARKRVTLYVPVIPLKKYSDIKQVCATVKTFSVNIKCNPIL